MDPILRRLGEINDLLEVPSNHFRGDLLAERDNLIDQLGADYLRATPRRRGAIRRFIRARHRLVLAFEDRVSWHAFRIKTVEDVGHLRGGLAATAIIGEGTDFRDFCLCIDHLFEAAARAGIDVRQYVQEVADLSGRWKRRYQAWCGPEGGTGTAPEGGGPSNQTKP